MKHFYDPVDEECFADCQVCHYAGNSECTCDTCSQPAPYWFDRKGAQVTMVVICAALLAICAALLVAVAEVF